MTTTLPNGTRVPDVASTNWAGDLEVNWQLLDAALGAIGSNVKTNRPNTWTAEQTFSEPIIGNLTGTASKAGADEDGTSIKTGYVNVAGNQTVTGQKVWTQAQVFQNNVYLANTSYTVGTIPTSNITSTCFFSGASNYQIGYCRSVVYKTTGQTSAELTARNKFTNGALDPNGDYTNATFTVNLDADGTRWIQFANSSIKNGLTPYTTDTYNIGSATNQWLRMFAKFYYYNGVAWGLDQNNTWTGINTFSSVTVKDTSALSNGDYGGALAFRDNQGNRHAYIQPYKNTSGVVNLVMGVDNSGSVQLNSSLIPYATNAISLGSSSYQWSSVYAQSYYYNGTAWGLDKENVWSGNNRFVKNAGLSDISTYSDNTMAFTANANTIFFNTRGSSNYPSYGTFLFAGYTSGSAPDRYGQLKLVRSTDIKGGTYDGYKPDSSFNLWRVAPHYSLMDFVDAVRVQNDGTNNYIAPITTNATDLGTSTNKWKTLNGTNPGALSLPSFSSSDPTMLVWSDLDTTNWLLDGTGNAVSIALDGYVYVSVICGTDGYVVITEGQYGYPNCFYMSTGIHIAGAASALLPVRKGIGITVYCKGTSIYLARFFPMQGNV